MSSKSKTSGARAWRIAPLVLSLAACGHATTHGSYGGASFEATVQARAPQLAPDAAPAAVVVAYAQTLPLGARADEVQWLATDLDLAHARTKSAFQAVWSELARQVRAGSVDLYAIRPYEDAAVAAEDAQIDKEAAALARVHDLLGPNERGTLAMNARNNETVRLTGAEVRPGQAARLANLTQMLDLDADQQRSVASVLDAQPPTAEMKAERDACMARVLDDFPTSTFDARASLVAGRSPSDMAREKIEHKAAFLAAIVPILRADQRERLAAHIESHQMAHEQ